MTGSLLRLCLNAWTLAGLATLRAAGLVGSDRRLLAVLNAGPILDRTTPGDVQADRSRDTS
jgi:hypothetical protein